MDEIKLSIIIPVYNTEQYLDDLFDSLFKQDLSTSEYEVICVNDGSTDNSLSILESWAEKYDNIRIINKENAGVSVARNTGLEVANGKYIWFVDGDDMIAENCLLKLVEILYSEELDCLIIGQKKVPGREEVFYSEISVNDVYTEERKEEYGLSTFFTFDKEQKKKILTNSMCQKIIKKSFYNEHNLKFNGKITFGEDEIVSYQAFKFLDRIGYLDKIVYFYRQRETSITHDNTVKRRKTVCLSWIRVTDFYSDELKLYNKDRKEVRQHIKELAQGRITLAFELLLTLEDKEFIKANLPKVKKHKYLMLFDKHIKKNPKRKFLELIGIITPFNLWFKMMYALAKNIRANNLQ